MKYQVVVNGENLIANLDGELSSVGFFTARIVEANNLGEAEAAAMRIVKSDIQDQNLHNSEGDIFYRIHDSASIQDGHNIETEDNFIFYKDED